jgi:hypothetical protein
MQVHPGHGPSTTIGRERATNPFLNGVARIVRRQRVMRRSEPELIQLATLAIWLGAAAFFSIAVRRRYSPLPSRTLAGEVVGRLLPGILYSECLLPSLWR